MRRSARTYIATNLYTTGRLEGREPGDQEIYQQEFSPD